MKTFILPLCITASLAMMHIMTFQEADRSLTVTTEDGTGKPIIYTFYGTIDPSIKQTGMTDSADERLLQVWKEKWAEAGWDARILNLDDAKRHPRFSEFDEKLQKIPLNGPNGYYNQLCYYRWLAMAEIGGGWMSDYDVLPMNIHIHNDYYQDGNFAIYSSIPGLSGGIPCLMSGSQSEWERMSFSILENGVQKHLDANLWSDFFAAIDVYREDEQMYRLYDLVEEAENIEWDAQSCHRFENTLAAHFCHSAMHKVNLQDLNMRPDFARNWIEEWNSKCDISSLV